MQQAQQLFPTLTYSFGRECQRSPPGRLLGLRAHFFLCPEPIHLRCAKWASPLLPQKERSPLCEFVPLQFGPYRFHNCPLTIMYVV